jgi:hypothetical protein
MTERQGIGFSYMVTVLSLCGLAVIAPRFFVIYLIVASITGIFFGILCTDRVNTTCGAQAANERIPRTRGRVLALRTETRQDKG